MAGPLSKHFYKNRIKRYSRVLGSILGELRVITNDKLVRLPLEYLGGLRDQSVASYKAGILPMATLKYVGFEVNTEKVLNNNRKEIFNGVLQKKRIPLFLDFEWSIRVKKQDEMFQIQEQVISAMYPTLDVLVKSEDGSNIDENIKIIPVSYDFVDSFEGDGEDPVYYDLTFMIRIEGGYIYGINSVNEGGNGSLIKEVIVDLSTGAVPFADSFTWFSIYDADTVLTNFPASLPLGELEGAYLFDGAETLEVIGSYNYIRG